MKKLLAHQSLAVFQPQLTGLRPKRDCLLARIAVAFLVWICVCTSHAQIATGTNGLLSLLDGTNNVTLQLPEIPQPGITIAVINTNQVLITITNGASFANYELYRRTLIDAGHLWKQEGTSGAQGQTNFIADMRVDLSFFQVGVGTNWDGDGAPNFDDGDPLDPAVGILTVTIDSPTQGGIFQ